jgi:probable HAF family extracellular repeat protein
MEAVVNFARRTPRALAAPVFAVACLAGQAATAGSYRVANFDVPGAIYTAIVGINKSGAIAGAYVGMDDTQRGFVVAAGEISTIEGPFAVETDITGINNGGTAVGYYKSAGVPAQAFFWSDNTLSPLAIGAYSRAFAVNNKGHVAGSFGLDVTSNKQQGFLYRSGRFEKFKAFNSDYTQPLAMNDSDEVVGIFWDPRNIAHSFLRKGTAIAAFDPPGAPHGSYATGINDAGQIVGFYADKGSTIHGYLYADGAFTTIDAPATTSETKLVGINTAGQVAGFYNNGGNTVPFVYTAGQFAFIDTGAATTAFTNGFNDNQTVVGQVTDGSGTHGFEATCPRLQRPCS